MHGPTVVATHRRSREPFARIVDAAHFVGLWRPAAAPDAVAPTLTALGRQLADYVAVVAGGAQ